ncbi:MAG: oligosaccharide flippase family protein [Candidatus Cryptobacteroides sp.]
MSQQSTNTRIAKNAAALYFRMIVTMLVGLYTSRVILQTLGVEDYGIYNVVGGFVSMFSLISGSLREAVSRFLTYELGRGDRERLRSIFSTSCFVMAGLSVIIVIATETIGLWYLYNKMVIPAERLQAAGWCFQLSVASFVLSLLSTPYTSAIISHERMGIYAWISILDAVLKLLICYAVMVSPADKLVSYAILLFIVGVIDQVVYWAYCRRNFEECNLSFVFEKSLFREMFSFAGWNFIGSSASVLRTQGAALMLNFFGGPLVNAANGIATQITSVVSKFVSNFTQAFNPQITKQYASGEYESLMKLLIYGSRFSYYLMFILALPVFLNARFILEVWLGIVPEYTVEFTRWTLVFLLADSVCRPIITAKNANGNIRNYQIVVGGVLLTMLPIAYIGLKCGLPVTFVPQINAVTAIVAIFARMIMLNGDFPCWSSRVFFKEVLLNVIVVSLIAGIVPTVSYRLLPEGWTNLIVTTLVSLVSSCLCVLFLGCSRDERKLMISKAKRLLRFPSRFRKQ